MPNLEGFRPWRVAPKLRLALLAIALSGASGCEMSEQSVSRLLDNNLIYWVALILGGLLLYRACGLIRFTELGKARPILLLYSAGTAWCAFGRHRVHGKEWLELTIVGGIWVGAGVVGGLLRLSLREGTTAEGSPGQPDGSSGSAQLAGAEGELAEEAASTNCPVCGSPFTEGRRSQCVECRQMVHRATCLSQQTGPGGRICKRCAAEHTEAGAEEEERSPIPAEFEPDADRMPGEEPLAEHETEDTSSQEMCWYCKSRPAEEKCETKADMYGNVHMENVETTAMGYTYKKAWNALQVPIPRCERCHRVHQTRGRWIMLFAAIPCLTWLGGAIYYHGDFLKAVRTPMSGRLWDWVLLVVAAVVGGFVVFGVGYAIGYILGRLFTSWNVPNESYSKEHPLVAELTQQGWKTGTEPGAGEPYSG